MHVSAEDLFGRKMEETIGKGVSLHRQTPKRKLDMPTGSIGDPDTDSPVQPEFATAGCWGSNTRASSAPSRTSAYLHVFLELGCSAFLINAAPLEAIPVMHDLLDGGNSLVRQPLVLEHCDSLAGSSAVWVGQEWKGNCSTY